MRSDDILNKVFGPDVLDVGCAGHIPKPGSAYWLHGRLREKFPSLVGIDLNEGNIQHLRDLGYGNIFVASAEDFSLNTKFDTIVAGELIEHLSNPGLFFERCHAHLNLNGRLVISTPYAYALLYMLYAFMKYPKTCQNDEHTVWFCPATISELATRYGFKVASWELIEDYELDNPSALYRFFARFITTVGRFLLPTRLRKNCMLFVFVSDSDTQTP
jgi:SAM-dependent methyltransferase